MNKGELVDTVAANTGATKKVADSVITAALDAIADALVKGDKVTLVGFGTFEVRDRAARQGRNPQSGAVIEIPAA
ncbi:MAG TPA: HU family DNA-binding protein, partial [Chroococcidiopsis sp.]